MSEEVSIESQGWDVDGDYDSNDENLGDSFKEYDIVSSPNDFNINTIFDFIESGVVLVPGFQRNYVWDIKRASKLIESIIIGLPIPQVFLYEESRNKFIVIDGQQRLMTIYYFMKKRFPRKDKRVELRKIYDSLGEIPEKVLADNEYFTDFNLNLPSPETGEKNGFHKLNFDTLDEYKSTFKLRTIRNIIIKQTLPKENDDSSKYEIFNRLNSGGVNLTPQEIRTSLYHSSFYDMLYKVNLLPEWRKVVGKNEPDLHMKDIEILLRGFAMLINGDTYKSPMTKFLNAFSKDAKKFKADQILYLEQLFTKFCEKVSVLGERAFLSKSGKFNISIYESIFTALTDDGYKKGTLDVKETDDIKIVTLKEDTDFINATQEGVAGATKVRKRLNRAKEIL